MPTVVLKYASNANISFHGDIELEIERSDWDELPQAERDEIIQEALNELVEIWDPRDSDNES